MELRKEGKTFVGVSESSFLSFVPFSYAFVWGWTGAVPVRAFADHTD